jgi:DNA repair exonuclease SbcCD ATPase subunit
LRAQHDETTAALQGLVGLEEERRRVREALAQFRALDGLATSSLLPQIAEHQKALQKRDEEARGLDQKIEEVQNRLALIPSVPLFRYPLLLAGAGLLILSVLAGQFLPYTGVGIFAGLGCAAAAVIQYLNRGQSRDKVRKTLAALEHQRDKGLDLRIGRQFQSLLDLLPRAGCREVSELPGRLRQRDALSEELATLDRKIAGLSTETDAAGLEGKKRSIEEAIQVAEEEIRSLGFVPEPSEIQREVEKIERSLAAAVGTAPVGREGPPQPVGALLDSLERHLGHLDATQLSAIDAQASRLVAEITAGRYSRVRRTPENGLRVVPAGGQEERTPGEVSDGTRDQVALAWHLALLAVALPGTPVPLLLDNPFACMDPARRKRLLPFLQSLARSHQAILFSHEAWISPEAAHIVALDR